MSNIKDEMQNRRGEFAKELESLINRYCQENESDTPDFILAVFLITIIYLTSFSPLAILILR